MKRLACLCLAVLAAGCGARPERPVAREVGDPLALTVLADSAEFTGLRPARSPRARPAARLTLVRIAASRADVGAALPVPEPGAPPERAGTAPDGGGDDALRPPIARGPAIVRLHSARRSWLELDVRVDEHGAVSDAIAVGGDADSATVRAATDAALALRWYPAMRHGRAVAVWCRQRFEAGPGR